MDAQNRGLASCELYDTSTNCWKAIPSMKTTRCFSAASCYNDRMYVFGGRLDLDCSLNDAEYYTRSSNKWVQLASKMSFARYELAAVCANGRIYLFGGCSGKQMKLEDKTECFDPATESFFAIQTPTFHCRAFAAVSVSVSSPSRFISPALLKN